VAGRSTVAKLPQPIREEVDAAIKRGATIDDIVARLRELGADHVSRSAVGRYTQQFREFAAQQRQIASVSQAVASEFGDADDLQGRFMIQLLNSVITRAILPVASGEEIELDGKELHYLARAVKDVASAAKTDVDREAKIRDETKKRAREEAAAAAESAGRTAGASEATIEAIKRKILGID
jgi:diacylglycerol kinase